MAANLTPQYLEAEADFKKAQTAEERLECLKRMYALLPKHKASEKMQADLKTRMSDLRKEVEQEKKNPKKVSVSYKIPKQGAGQFVLLGGPNAGKSRVLSRLTRATPEVAPYPFTTREPQAGMMEWEDVRVQLIDLPPITADFLESYVSSMVRSADAALLLIDLGDDDGPFAAETAIERLTQNKTVLAGENPAENPDPTIETTRTLIVANKSDLPGALDRLEIVREMFGERFTIHLCAAETGVGLPELREAIFRFLKLIRVYTRQPGKPPDMTSPLPVLSHASGHGGPGPSRFCPWPEIGASGTGSHGQTVKRDHVLHEGDVVELHM